MTARLISCSRRWLQPGVALMLSAAIAQGQGQVTMPAEINLFGAGAGLPFQQGDADHGDTDKATKSPYSQTLIFLDGRQIHGELVKMSGDEILWHRPDASEPLRFSRREVQRVVVAPVSQAGWGVSPEELAGGQAPNPAGKDVPNGGVPIPATLRLSGVDWLYGDVRSTDGQTFIVRLEDGTPLTVPRPQLAWMHFGGAPVPSVGFAGAALDMSSWLPASATMEVSEGTLTVRGAEWLGRALPSLTRFELAFELPEGCEEGTSFWLHPSEPDLECSQSGTVGIRFCHGYIARMLFFGGFEQSNSPLPERALREDGPAKYRVFYDGPTRRIIVMRNGVQVCDWSFLEPGSSPNFQVGGLSFHRDDHGKTEVLRFKRIQVRPWNGADRGDTDPGDGRDHFSYVNAASPITGQLENVFTPGHGIPLDLAGAARLTGKLQSVTETELLVSGTSRPRKSGLFVQFPHEPSALPDAEAKVRLGRQGEFCARNLEVHDGRLRCATAFAPSVEVPMSALRSLALPRQPVKDAAPAANSADALIFKNGDELEGKAISADARGPVRWKLTGGQELAFQVERLAGVRLAGAAQAAMFHPAAMVEMRNGDQLRGQLVDLDERHLRLRHPGLGVLALDRDRLWHLYPSPQCEVLDGGFDPGEWVRERQPSWPRLRPLVKRSASGKWRHFDGIYLLCGGSGTPSFDFDDWPGLQRQISPALERFEVRLEAASSNPGADGFLLQLLSERRGPSLRAVVTAQEIQMNISKSPETIQRGWHNYPLEGKLAGPPSRLALRVFVDCIAGTCDLYLNGVSIAHLGRSPNERMNQAGYLARFQPCQNNAMVNALSHLWIGPWSGELPQPSGQAGPCTSLANGDAVRVAPKEMHDGAFSIESESGPVDISVEKVTSVDFGGAVSAQSVAGRLRLADGTRIDVEDFHLQDGELTAHSVSLGNLRLPVVAARELVFNPPPARAPTTPQPKSTAQKDAEDKDQLPALAK